jgi:hypothetical protein
MEPEIKPTDLTDIDSPTLTNEVDTPVVEVDVNPEEGAVLTTLPASEAYQEQWRQFGEKAYTFLSSLPDYVTEFFSQYRRPIITIALIFGAFLSVKLTLALLDAINDIPLLAPTLELVGLGYTAWFIYRYLLRASNRQELGEEIKSLRDQIVGRTFPKS